MRLTERKRALVVVVAALGASAVVLHLVHGGPMRTRVVVTSRLVSAPAETTWQAIGRIDAMSAELPFALTLGLPIPTTCTLDSHGMGARRVCHFKSGAIEQRVTRWEPPSRMDLAIEATRMPGSDYLHYQTASYELAPENGQTRVTRTTTLVSTLQPAWYFGALEEWGMQSEHDYVLKTIAEHAENSHELGEEVGNQFR